MNGILDVPVGSSSTTSGSGSGSGTAQSFTGDLEVLYKITADGRIQAKFFNRSNQNNPTREALGDYTQGLGILYRKDFKTWSDFFKLFFGGGKKEEKDTD